MMNRKGLIRNALRKNEKKRSWYKVCLPLIAVVVFVTTYMLILPAMTQESKSYCGKEEHTHNKSCYTTEKTLVCGKEESEGHTHTDECYETQKELICGKEEGEAEASESSTGETEEGSSEDVKVHHHTDDCYKETEVLVCDKEESEGHTHTDECYKEEQKLSCNKKEHTHTLQCYSNPDADVETSSVWKRSVSGADLSGIYSEDVVAVAKTQLGYHESTSNYKVQKDGKTMKGYTRYGAWYGKKYKDWDAMFVAFCYHYAGIDTSVMPKSSSSAKLRSKLSDKGLYHSASGDYEVKAGDLAFFGSDHVGIVVKVSDGSVQVIEGDCSNKVQKNSYGSSSVSGYGELKDNKESEEASEATTEEAPEATTATDKEEAPEATTAADQEEAPEASTEVISATEATTETADAAAGSFKAAAKAKDGMKVTVSGDMASLPEGSEDISVFITKLSDKEAKSLAKEAGVDTKTNDVLAYDVSLYSGTKEIEPDDKVTVTFEKEDIGKDNNSKVYHFSDSSNKAEKMDLSKDKNGKVQFETDSFSKYLVTTEGVTYDSDLKDFLTSATMTDYAGNEIKSGDTVYIGQNYTITMSFAESNKEGAVKQFHYDDEGYLTYQLDTTNLKLKEVANAEIKQEDGTVVGHYWLSTDGTLKVQFDNVDSDGKAIDKTYFDEYMNTVFNLSFDATVTSTKAGDDITIPFSDDIEITGKVDTGGDLDVTKTAGTANSAKHSMDFTVKVKCTEGLVSDIVLFDNPYSKYGNAPYSASIDIASITFTDLKGNALEKQPVVEQQEDGTYKITYPYSLQAGEGFLVKYNVIAGDDVYEAMVKKCTESGDSRVAGNVNFGNKVEVTGDNGTDTPVDKTAEVEKTSWTSLMSKSHSDTTLTDSEGNKLNVIQWTVSIGDGYKDIGGNTVTDTIGSALSFVTDSGNYDYINVWVKHKDGKASTVKYYFDQTKAGVEHVTLSADGKTASFVLPEDCVTCNITYYTRYNENDTGKDAYKNTATISGKISGSASDSSTAGTGVAGIEKTVTNADANYIYYQIKVDVPASMYEQYINIMDRGIDTNESGISFGCKMSLCKDFKVTVQKDSDSEPVEYTYSSTPGTGTYNWADQDGGNYWSLWLNNSVSSKDQKWPIDEHSVVTITFAYPRDVKSEGKTINDVLWNGHYVRNQARVYYINNKNCKTAYATYYSTSEMRKTGEKDSNGYMNYTVEYATYETNNADNKRTATISKPFSNAYLYDDFDSQLDFVKDKGISCKAENVKTGKSVEFKIDADKIEFNASESTLKAYWKDFTAEGKDLETFLNGEDLANYKLHFSYYMNPSSSAIAKSPDSIKLSNKAKVGYTGITPDGDSYKYETEPVSFDYTYKTDLLDKKGVQKVAGGNEIDYSIDVNKDATDLSDGDTYQVEDQMSDNMTLYLDSIVLNYSGSNWRKVSATNKTSKEEFTAAYKSAYPDSADKAEEYWNELKKMQDSYAVTYDESSHKIVFTVPDNCYVKITYTTKVNETGESVNINNIATIKGLISVTTEDEASYEINKTSGSASGSKKYLYVLKQNSVNKKAVAGAKIALYGASDKGISAPEGTDQTITVDGTKMYYYATFESTENEDKNLNGTFKITDEYLADGGFYALKEIAAPEHYQISDEAIPFYWDSKPDDAKSGVEVKQNRDTLIFQNTPVSYTLPATGGSGTLLLTMSGLLLVLSALGISLFRFRRVR